MGLFQGWNGDARVESAKLHKNLGTMLGGIPNNHDIIPSAMCVFAYILLLVPIFWRMKRKELDYFQLWRPLLVILSRIASFSIRIKLAEGHDWDKDAFIAHLVLFRISPVLLTSALISLFQDAVFPYLPREDSPKERDWITWTLKHFVNVLQIGCYFAFGVTLAIAFDVHAAINGNTDAHDKLHLSKELLMYLLLAINFFMYILLIVPLVLLKKGLYDPRLANTPLKEVSKFISLIALTTFLMVISVFKVVQLISPKLNDHQMYIINKKTLFYSVCVMGEYIACALFVILPWNRIIPRHDHLEANLAHMPPFRPQDRDGNATDGELTASGRQRGESISTSSNRSEEIKHTDFATIDASHPIHQLSNPPPFSETQVDLSSPFTANITPTPYLYENGTAVPQHTGYSNGNGNGSNGTNRASSVTLSTISEVGRKRCTERNRPKTPQEQQEENCQQERKPMFRSQSLDLSGVLGSTSEQARPQSRAESVATSHWSDDSDEEADEKKTLAIFLSRTKSSLSAKGRRMSNGKGGERKS